MPSPYDFQGQEEDPPWNGPGVVPRAYLIVVYKNSMDLTLHN